MLQTIKTKARRASAVVICSALAAPMAFAQETVDPGIDAINKLSDTATKYIGAAFAVAVLVAGGFWGIRMMKKSFGAAK